MRGTPSFSKDAIDELHACLGSDARVIIPILKNIVATFPQLTAEFENEVFGIRQEWEERVSHLQAFLIALRSLQRAVKALPREDQLLGVQLRKNLKKAEARAASKLAELRSVLDNPFHRRKRGGPRNERRRRLCKLRLDFMKPLRSR